MQDSTRKCCCVQILPSFLFPSEENIKKLISVRIAWSKFKTKKNPRQTGS